MHSQNIAKNIVICWRRIASTLYHPKCHGYTTEGLIPFLQKAKGSSPLYCCHSRTTQLPGMHSTEEWENTGEQIPRQHNEFIKYIQLKK